MKKVKWSFLITTVLVSAVALTACEDTDNTPVIYYADIVSVHKDADDNVTFEQILVDDKGSITLQPEAGGVKFSADDFDEGQRIQLYYTVNSISPDSMYNITVQQLGYIKSDTIITATADSIAAYPNDPILMNTRWRTGAYLNFNISIEYYSKPHRLDLFYNPIQASTDTLDVILLHDRNKDYSGYWTEAYASFYVPEMVNPQYKAIRIHANMTNQAIGYIVMKLRD